MLVDRRVNIPPAPVSNSPRLAGEGVIVVSVKFAVVNLPKGPLLGVFGAATAEEVVVLELLAKFVTVVDMEVDGVVHPGLLDDVRIADAADVLNAVIVSNETVGFFSLPSLTCNAEVQHVSTPFVRFE